MYLKEVGDLVHHKTGTSLVTPRAVGVDGVLHES